MNEKEKNHEVRRILSVKILINTDFLLRSNSTMLLAWKNMMHSNSTNDEAKEKENSVDDKRKEKGKTETGKQ